MSKRFQVIIAEDEVELCRGLMLLVNEHPDFDTVFCAGNGTEVLRYLDTHPVPDVLLTDIRMPGMDGLTLLKRLHESQYRIRPVIISGYNQFEYAQKAMKYGASDYMLKPLQRQDCMNMLDALAADLSDRTEAVFDLSRALGRRTLTLPAHTQELYLLAACLGNYPFSSVAPHPDEAAFHQALHAAGFAPQGVAAFGLRGGVQFLLCEMPDDHAAQRLLQNIYAEIACRTPVEYPSSLLALCRCPDSPELYTVASRLQAQMRRSAVLGCCIALDMTNPAGSVPQHSTFGTLFPVDEKLSDDIRRSDYAAFSALLKEKFDKWNADHLPIAALMDYIKFQYIYTAQQIFSSASTDTIPIPYEWESQLEVAFTKCADWDMLYNTVFELFAGLFDSYHLSKVPRNVMREIEQYIERHYTQHITNQSLARHFGFVPSYISRMFRDYKGISPCDYLTHVRIENAKRLIWESDDVNFNELACALGFSDSSYFSKLFKKSVGITPTEYKLSCIKQHDNPHK